MKKLFHYWVIILLIFSCKQEQKAEQLTKMTEAELYIEKLPKTIAINTKAVAILNNWQTFNDFDTSFKAVYQAENHEDMILIIEDLIEKQKLLEDSDYPESLNTAQIKSRQKVLKTYILKVKSALEYRTDIITPSTEMIKAYNALRNQFNVTMNSTLDTKLMFDE